VATAPAPEPEAKPKAAPKAKAEAPKAAPAKAATAPVKPKTTPAPAKPKAAPLNAIGIPGAAGAPDNLLLLKGVGPKLNTLLGTLEISRFDQIAAWGKTEIAKVDAHLGAFKGRIERDAWIEQAGLLAKGKIADFEAKFGKLDSENR
jgi:predicted flap endonuclease-1-like 5' DNA nuclease